MTTKTRLLCIVCNKKLKNKINFEKHIQTKTHLKLQAELEQEIDLDDFKESDDKRVHFEGDSESVGSFIDDDEYELGMPIDVVNWKEEIAMDILKSEQPELHKTLLEVEEFLTNEYPNFLDIMKKPMCIKDRAHILELYRIMEETEPLTMEWIQMKMVVSEMLKQSINAEKIKSNMDDETRKRVDNELVQLESMDDDSGIEYKICILDLPRSDKCKIYREYKRLEGIDMASEEHGKLKEWLDTVIRFPWGIQRTIPEHNFGSVISKLKQRFDSTFYGMQTVKDQLLLYIHHRLLYPDNSEYALGLVGKPGTGKSSIITTLSNCMDIPFSQLPGGTFSHPDNIYGHSYTYIGSKMGEIAKACMRMNSLNGILFIDEFEKIPLGSSLNSVLEILDPIQNSNFRDRYVGDIPINLSGMIFILSMNGMPLNQALANRIFPIKIPDYSFHQKISILQEFTIPKLLKKLKLDLDFHRDAICAIIEYSDTEDGVRSAIQVTQDIIRKFCFILHAPCKLSSFTLKDWKKGDPIHATHIHQMIDKDTLMYTKNLSMYA